MAIKTFIFKNNTDGQLIISDLSGITMQQGDVMNVTDMYANYTLYESLDLKTAISGSQLIINDGTSDLNIEDALIYCSYDTPISQIPGMNINSSDGTYSITVEGDTYVSVSRFLCLEDTPCTFSGQGEYNVRVKPDESGLEFYSHDSEHPYGTQYNFIRSCDEESTTSEDWVHKGCLTASGIDPAGEYRIGWSYEYRYETTNYQIETRIRVNDEFVIADVANRAVNSSDWFSNGGFHIMPGTTASGGVFNIELEYRTQKYNFAAHIRRVRLDIWRVK